MGRTTQVPCDTEYPAFISERTIKENTGHLDCDGCFKYEKTHMHMHMHKRFYTYAHKHKRTRLNTDIGTHRVSHPL